MKEFHVLITAGWYKTIALLSLLYFARRISHRAYIIAGLKTFLIFWSKIKKNFETFGEGLGVVRGVGSG